MGCGAVSPDTKSQGGVYKPSDSAREESTMALKSKTETESLVTIHSAAQSPLDRPIFAPGIFTITDSRGCTVSACFNSKAKLEVLLKWVDKTVNQDHVSDPQEQAGREKDRSVHAHQLRFDGNLSQTSTVETTIGSDAPIVNSSVDAQQSNP